MRIHLFSLILILFLGGCSLASHSALSQSNKPLAEDIELVSHIGGRIRSLFVKDNLAYLGIGPKLVIVDVSNSEQPVAIGFLLLSDTITAIQVVDNYAYIANRSGGLRIVDVANPELPIELSHLVTPESALDVAVRDNRVYLAMGPGGLLSVDVSNPVQPRKIKVYEVPDGSFDVSILGNYVYTINSFATRVQVVDVSDTTGGNLNFTASFPMQNITVVHPYAYIASEGLFVFDISDPTTPTEAGHHYTHFGRCEPDTDVAVSGVQAYITIVSSCTGGWSRLIVLDISNPSEPTTIGIYETEIRGVSDIEVVDDHVYIAEWYGGLMILDVSNPASPTQVGFYWPGPGPIIPNDVAVQGNYAYMIGGYHSSGFWVVDISTPAMPNITGYAAMPSQALGVDVAGNYAYVANDHNGLRILDISNPNKPVEVSSLNIPGYTDSVTIKDDYAYVGGDRGVTIVNIASPRRPYEVGYNDLPILAYDIEVTDHYAYVAGGGCSNGFWILDISDPLAPVTISRSKGIPGVANSVELFGDYAYITADGEGVHVVDISSPDRPILIDTYKIAGRAEIFGGNLYVVSQRDNGLQVLDISSPVNPIEIGFHQMPVAHNINVKDEYIYLAGDGLFIFRLAKSIR